MSLRNRLLVAFVSVLALSLANVVAARLLSQRNLVALATLRTASADKLRVLDLQRQLVDRWREVSLSESLILTKPQRTELARRLDALDTSLTSVQTQAFETDDDLREAAAALVRSWRAGLGPAARQPPDAVLRLVDARLSRADERIATAAGDVSRLIAAADRISFALSVTTCVLALGIGVHLWLHVVAWLTRLQDVTGRIAKGDLTTRLEGQRGELGRVAETFNAMAQELAGTMVTLEAARAEAERANAAKTAVLRIVSHDLRDPMNSILGYCGLVRQGLEHGDSREALTDLGEIEEASRRLLGFVNQFLDLSRLESGRMPVAIDEYDVRTLVSEVLNTVRPLASTHGVTLETSMAQDAGWIRTDAMKVRQILVNLMGNACKFAQGGTVRLTVTRGRIDGVVFEVRDTGAGMTPDLLGRVFQPFEQAEEGTAQHFGGTGLGLAIAKGFCELLKGRISASSTPGRGTAFTVELPSVTVVADEGRPIGGQLPPDPSWVTLAS